MEKVKYTEIVSKVKYKYGILVLLFIIVGGFLFAQISRIEKTGGDSVRLMPAVSVLQIKDYRTSVASLQTVGVVESSAQAEIKSQISASVGKIYVYIGDFVYRGQVLLELTNTDLLAQLDQAEANISIQKSKLDELRRGTRPEELDIQEIKVQNAAIVLENAKKNLVVKLQDAYTKSDDAVRNRVDQFFRNPRTSNPQLNFLLGGQSEIDIEWERFLVENTLEVWDNSLGILAPESDLFLYIDKAEQNLTQIKSFLDKVALAVNGLEPNSNLSLTTISAWKADVVTARTNINTAITNIAGSEEELRNAESGLLLMQKEFELKISGTAQEQIISQEFQVKQAEAQVASLNAQLAKTVVRSPIEGAVVAITPRVGEFVSQGQLIAHIVDNRGLQVKAYVNSEDAQKITVGSQVTVESKLDAAVSRIAPGVDPATQKVEVLIALTSAGASNLVFGQYVNITLTQTKQDNAGSYFLPLRSVKVTTDGAYVYALNAENKIEERRVELGSVLDDLIEVNSGLQNTATILESVRGLEVGQEVITK